MWQLLIPLGESKFIGLLQLLSKPKQINHDKKIPTTYTVADIIRGESILPFTKL